MLFGSGVKIVERIGGGVVVVAVETLVKETVGRGSKKKSFF